jgi:hypothetical protein
MKKVLIALTTALTLALAVCAARAGEEKQPDATIELKEGSVAAGIGFSWGSGTLTYKGKTYPVSVEGLSVGSVGIAQATASGKVYGLKDIKDFDGNYTAATAGLTAAGGGSATVMKNQNGVSIELVSTTQGVKVTLAASGVKLKIKQ